MSFILQFRNFTRYCRVRQGAPTSPAPEPGSLCQACTVPPESIKEITYNPLAFLSRLPLHPKPLPLRQPSSGQTENFAVLWPRGRRTREPGVGAQAQAFGVLSTPTAGHPFPHPRPAGATRRSRGSSPCPTSTPA